MEHLETVWTQPCHLRPLLARFSARLGMVAPPAHPAGPSPVTDRQARPVGTSERFLIAMSIFFPLPCQMWRLCRTDHWAPLVAVQIVAGILLRPGVLGPAAGKGLFVVAAGMPCAVIALPILILLLERLGLLYQPLGQRTLRCASLDDVAIRGVQPLLRRQRAAQAGQAAPSAVIASISV